jgi:O-antigen ligase
MSLVQAVTVGLVALILAPGWFFYFDVTPKLLVLLVGAALCALLWRGERPSRTFTILTLLTAVSAAVSAAVSSSPALSVFGSTWRRYGVVAQLAVLLLAWTIAAAGDRARLVLLRSIAVASGVAALYGIAQYAGWDPLLPSAGYHIGEGLWTIVRPPGTMGYVSYFATWLLMGGFLSLALGRSDSSAIWRRIAYAAAGLSLVAMALTGTRAAFAGLGLGLIAAAWRLGFRIPRRALAAVAGLAVAAGVFYFSPAGWPLRSRTRWFIEDPWGGARPLLWRDSLRMGAARPVAGFGPEVFLASFPRYESRDLARAYPDFAHESPHNIFLDALVSQGIPGMACLLGFCALGLAAAWRAREPWILAALIAGIAAQQFTAFTIPTALLFYVTVALATPREQPRSAGWPRIPLFAAAAFFIFCAVRYGAADHALQMTRRDIAARDLRAAASDYARYRRVRLPGASADLWYSRALLSVPAVLPAGQAALSAVRNPEDPFDAWYNLAEIYAIGNSAAETERCLRAAAAANPVWFKPHWMLAQVLRLEGRVTDAAAEAATATDLDGGRHAEVGRTAAEIAALQK